MALAISLLQNPIKGVLLDITGVLYESGDNLGTVINGSIQAVARLKQAGCPFRLVTNETTCSTEKLFQKLSYHGFSICLKDIISPIPAMKTILKQRNLHPQILVHPNVAEEFDEFVQESPTCVVMGDADESFSFVNMNKSFNCLMKMEKPILFSLGKGKYYKHCGMLQLDVGAFAAALEYACDIEAITVGKPSPVFFKAALDDMGIAAEEAVMIGDDINSDIGGAQKCGMRGILVKTGKFSSKVLAASEITPDFVADNLSHAIETIGEVLSSGHGPD